MIDHITRPVSDYQKSKRFYEAALKPLVYRLLQDFEEQKIAGFGIEDTLGKRDFWIREDPEEAKGSKYCLAFKADSKEMVEEFYKAAIAAGGKDFGSPGYRERYHAGYYAAFVLDPDSYNIEAVFDDVSK